MTALTENEFIILDMLGKFPRGLDLKNISEIGSIKSEEAGPILSRLIENKFIELVDDQFMILPDGSAACKSMMKRKDAFNKKEVWELDPAGGINIDLGLVYEPIQRNDMLYNWRGKKGISPIQNVDKKFYFKIGETKFYLNSAPNEDIVWVIPDYEIFEKWVTGKKKSKSIWDIYDKTIKFSKIFFDTGTTSYHTLLFLAGLQSWFAPYLPARFFVEVIGGFSGGKTTVLDILECFCRHGYLVGNQTIAFVGRSLKKCKITSLCDEFDVHIEEDPELLALVRSSQRKGHYARANIKGGIESFETKGAFYYTVHGEIDRALSSRAMTIYTTKTDLVGLGKINLMKNELGKDLLTDWFLWYLDNAIKMMSKIKINEPSWETLEKLVAIQKKNSNISKNDENEKLKESCPNGCPITATRKMEEEKLSVENKGIVAIKDDNNNNIYIYRDTLIHMLEQPGQLSSLVGRDEELSTIISMILGCLDMGNTKGNHIINGNQKLETIKNDITELFEIKKSRIEEFTDTGDIGGIRDTIIRFYEKNNKQDDYWTKDGEFMIPNKELKEIVYTNFKAEGKFAPSNREFSSIMRDLGFEKNISRKKMKARTKQGRDDGDDKVSLLCNILTKKVCNRIGLNYKNRGVKDES